MIARTRTRSAVVVVALTLVLGACVSAPSANVPIEQRALADIGAADTLYIATLQAAGDLHRAHKLSDDAFARVLAVGEKVRVARESAVQALLAYLTIDPASAGMREAGRKVLDVAIARLAAVVLELRTEVPTS